MILPAAWVNMHSEYPISAKQCHSHSLTRADNRRTARLAHRTGLIKVNEKGLHSESGWGVIGYDYASSRVTRVRQILR